MNKSLIVVLALLLVCSFAGTAFAAANPFVDVPKSHWAYDAVKKLAQDGIITGDTTDRLNGTKPVTRYEMAKAVAKAMGKAEKASADDRELIKRLSAEFSDELADLNVRVSNLEKEVDRINIGTAVVIKYDDRSWIANSPASQGKERFGDTIPGYMLNTFADYKINDTWTFSVMGQLTRDMHKTASLVTSNRDQVKNICAKGRIGAVDVKLGKFDYNDATYATVFGDQIMGLQLTFGAPAKPSGPPGGPPPSPSGNRPSSGSAGNDEPQLAAQPPAALPPMPGPSGPILTLTSGWWDHTTMVMPPWELSDGTVTNYHAAEVTLPVNKTSNFSATYQALSKPGQVGSGMYDVTSGDPIPSRHWVSVGFDTKLDQTWKFRSAYWKSSYATKNTGYLIGVITPMAAFFIPGAWDFEFDYVHAGANSVICQQGGWGDYTRGTRAVDLKITYTVHPGFQWQCEYIVQRALAVDNWHDRFLRFTWSYLLF